MEEISSFKSLMLLLTEVKTCRLQAQAVTLAALAGAAAVEYYDRRMNPESKDDRYSNQYLAHAHKD